MEKELDHYRSLSQEVQRLKNKLEEEGIRLFFCHNLCYLFHQKLIKSWLFFLIATNHSRCLRAYETAVAENGGITLAMRVMEKKMESLMKKRLDSRINFIGDRQCDMSKICK